MKVSLGTLPADGQHVQAKFQAQKRRVPIFRPVQTKLHFRRLRFGFTDPPRFTILWFLVPGADTDGNLVTERNDDLPLVV
jgi:hypothetical protein